MSTGSRTTGRGSRAKPLSSTAFVPVAAVNPLVRAPDATGGEVVRDGSVIMVTWVPYVAHGVVVPASEVFCDAEATLTSIDPLHRMLTMRVVWSATFLDEGDRDELFGRLAERVHRWDDWGGMARHRGATALTVHLLTLLVVSPVGAAGRGHASGEAS